MEAMLIAALALLLISLVILLPCALHAQQNATHAQTLADMQQITNDAKADLTGLHRAYRAELARTARRPASTRRIS